MFVWNHRFDVRIQAAVEQCLDIRIRAIFGLKGLIECVRTIAVLISATSTFQTTALIVLLSIP